MEATAVREEGARADRGISWGCFAAVAVPIALVGLWLCLWWWPPSLASAQARYAAPLRDVAPVIAALNRYHHDRGYYPPALCALTREGYLRELPQLPPVFHESYSNPKPGVGYGYDRCGDSYVLMSFPRPSLRPGTSWEESLTYYGPGLRRTANDGPYWAGWGDGIGLGSMTERRPKRYGPLVAAVLLIGLLLGWRLLLAMLLWGTPLGDGWQAYRYGVIKRQVGPALATMDPLIAALEHYRHDKGAYPSDLKLLLPRYSSVISKLPPPLHEIGPNDRDDSYGYWSDGASYSLFTQISGVYDRLYDITDCFENLSYQSAGYKRKAGDEKPYGQIGRWQYFSYFD